LQTGALVGSAFCPIVGTIVGATVGVLTGVIYENSTEQLKVNATKSLTNALR
jgi:uncharacterized membrane protein